MLDARLNISQTAPDTTLQQVQDRIEGEWLVAHALGPDGVEGVIKAHFLLRERAPGFTLDLIAHSRRGVLQLGAWTVDGQRTSAALRQACTEVLGAMELREIRLLGCNTALTVQGQAAMRRLHQLFGVPVYGTKVPISARDFDRAGFHATGILTNQDHLPPVSSPTLESATIWHDRFDRVPGHGGLVSGVAPLHSQLRRETLAEALRDWTRALPRLRWPIRRLERAQFESVLGYAERVPAWAPGLLALPELEILTPAPGDGEPRFHRLTVLLDGYWLRIYPRDRGDGIVLRADGDDPLFDALNQGTEIRLS